MRMLDDLKVKEPSDDDQRQNGAYGEYEQCAEPHFHGLSAQQGGGFFGFGLLEI